MAQTVYAGQLGVGLGLQGASETIADSMAIQNDNALVKAKLSQMAATEEAVELENKIREDERQRANQEASIEGLILRHALDPEGAAGQLKEQGAEAFSEPFKGLTAAQSAKLQGIVGLGQHVTEQRDATDQIANELNMAWMQAQADPEASPFYAEKLAEIQQRIPEIDPLNPEAVTPQELAAEYRSLREQDFQYRVQKSHRDRAVADYDTSFGQSPEFAFGRTLAAIGEYDDAIDFGFKAKYPTAYKKTTTKAQEEVVSKVRIDLAQDWNRFALANNWAPGSEEYLAGQEAYYDSMRDALGEEVVPKTPRQQAREAKEQQEDSWLKLLHAAGLDIEESVKVVELGDEAVQKALAGAAEADAKERAKAAAEAKDKAKRDASERARKEAADKERARAEGERGKKAAGAVKRAQETMGIPPGRFERDLLPPE